MIQRSENVKVVSHSELEERDKQGPNADLVIRSQSSEPTKQVI